MEKDSLYYLVRDTVATYAERPCYWVKADGQNLLPSPILTGAPT